MEGLSFVVLFKDDPKKDLFFSFTKGVTNVAVYPEVEGTSVIVTGEGVDTEKVFPQGINCLDPAEEVLIVDIKSSPLIPKDIKQIILVDYGNDEQADFILLPWWVIERYAPEAKDEMNYVIRIKGPDRVYRGWSFTEYFSVERPRTTDNQKI